MVTGDAYPFDLAVCYWPASSGMWWWQHFRRDETRKELDVAQQFGCTHVCVNLVWNDFQPDRSRLATPVMRCLDQFLDDAADRGIRVRCVLFPVRLGKLNWLPSWALELYPDAHSTVLSGHYRTHRAVKNLYSDETMVRAASLQVREIIGAFSGHPTISGWVLGAGMSWAAMPKGSGAFQHWLGTMAEAARLAGADVPLLHEVSARDLICDRACALPVLPQLGVVAQVVDDWRPGWASATPALWTSFLAGFTGRLALGGAIVRSTHLARLSSPEEAEQLLTLVRQAGGRGFVADFLFDFEVGLVTSPPFQECPELLQNGLIDLDGIPARAMAAWQGNHQAMAVMRPDEWRFPDVDSELRERSPEEVAHECYREYLR